MAGQAQVVQTKACSLCWSKEDHECDGIPAISLCEAVLGKCLVCETFDRLNFAPIPGLLQCHVSSVERIVQPAAGSPEELKRKLIDELLLLHRKEWNTLTVRELEYEVQKVQRLQHRQIALSEEESKIEPTRSPLGSSEPYHHGECKTSFSTQSGFAKHEQLHSDNQIQKSFACEYCSKGYTSLSALKMHTRTHTLPCKCDVCGKSFSRQWVLKGHFRTHTGEKPFACTYCSRPFADKSNLRAHLQTQHLQTKKYSCLDCKKTFSRMSLLNKHTDDGCRGLRSRSEECAQTLVGLSTSAS